MLIIDYLDEDVKELIGKYLLKTIKKKKRIEQKHSRKYHIADLHMATLAPGKINMRATRGSEAANLRTVSWSFVQRSLV